MIRSSFDKINVHSLPFSLFIYRADTARNLPFYISFMMTWTEHDSTLEIQGKVFSWYVVHIIPLAMRQLLSLSCIIEVSISLSLLFRLNALRMVIVVILLCRSESLLQCVKTYNPNFSFACNYIAAVF